MTDSTPIIGYKLMRRTGKKTVRGQFVGGPYRIGRWYKAVDAHKEHVDGHTHISEDLPYPAGFHAFVTKPPKSSKWSGDSLIVVRVQLRGVHTQGLEQGAGLPCWVAHEMKILEILG